MPLSTIVILGVIVAMFAAFIVAIGGVATWQVLSDQRDEAKDRARRQNAKIVTDAFRKAA